MWCNPRSNQPTPIGVFSRYRGLRAERHGDCVDIAVSSIQHDSVDFQGRLNPLQHYIRGAGDLRTTLTPTAGGGLLSAHLSVPQASQRWRLITFPHWTYGHGLVARRQCRCLKGFVTYKFNPDLLRQVVVLARSRRDQEPVHADLPPAFRLLWLSRRVQSNGTSPRAAPSAISITPTRSASWPVIACRMAAVC